MDKNEAVKLCNPLFYLPLQAFENMNKKSAFTVVVKLPRKMVRKTVFKATNVMLVGSNS